MGFQKKIFLWMLGTLVAILVPTLVLVESRLKGKAAERISAEFESQVDLVVSERSKRLAEVEAAAADLARSPHVMQSLEGTLTDSGRREFAMEVFARKRPDRERERRIRPENGEKTPAQLLSTLPVLCTIDLEGNFKELNPVRASSEARKRSLRIRRSGDGHEKIHQLGLVMEKQVGYFINETPGRGRRLQEVIVTPVSNDSGEFKGMFIMGIDAETPFDHLFALLERSTDGASGTKGFFAEGEIVQVKGLKNVDREELAALVAEEISGTRGMADIRLNDQPYRLAYQELNPGSVLESAYQIAFFPLADVHAELRNLEMKMLLAGLAAVLLAAFASFWIARGLARPVQMMEKATRRVREGDFSVRVPVQSKDEIGRLGESFNEMTADLALKERYREVLSKVSDAAVAQALIDGQMELGGETRFLTVLFCDIRGFTELTEAMPPHDIIALLNKHMTAMTEIVYAHKGVVDKFIGDEIMAIFGAPKSYGNDPENAVRCAVAMIEKRKALNATCRHPFEIGVGVASGEMVAGCMGSVDRLNYTVVGEPVNLAARLCGKAGPGEVLAAVPDGIAEGETVRVEAKGFSEPIEAVRVVRVLSPVSTP